RKRGLVVVMAPNVENVEATDPLQRPRLAVQLQFFGKLIRGRVVAVSDDRDRIVAVILQVVLAVARVVRDRGELGPRHLVGEGVGGAADGAGEVSDPRVRELKTDLRGSAIAVAVG